MCIFHDKNKNVEQLEFKKGDVIRVNGKNDLALIQVKSISKNIVPIEIAKSFPRLGKTLMQSDIPTMSFGPIHVDMLVRFGKNTNGIMIMNSTYHPLFKHKLLLTLVTQVVRW